MSYDVQMFVPCNHIIRVAGLPNPTIPPTAIVLPNANSYLQSGTYYITYTWSNLNGETLVSDFSKVFLYGNQSIEISATDYLGKSDVETTFNFYVGYTAGNLMGELTQEQLDLEKIILKEQLYKQISSATKKCVLTEHSINGEYKPTGNSTIFKSFVDKEDACVRCYGKGFYFDIFFDQTGQPIKATNQVKLLQELLKIIIEDKNSNPFHQDWGCDVTKRIGTKKKGVADKFKVELSVRDAVEYLKNIQHSNRQISKNTSPAEIIDSIQLIRVEEDGPLGYNVYVEVLSAAGEVIAYNVNL